MSQIRWVCNDCKKQGVIKVGGIFNPYIVGYKIYSSHEKKSPGCLDFFNTIVIEKDYQLFSADPLLQAEFMRIKRLGGRIKITEDKIVVNPGIIPKFVVETLINRIREIDIKKILKIEVME